MPDEQKLEMLSYLDFDLLIERSGRKYLARVLTAPAGEAVNEFKQPFTGLELENFYLRLGRPRRGIRRLDSPEMETARSYGGRLFDNVFGGEVQSCLLSSLNTAKAQGKGLRIRLRIDASDLNNLPWEYLYSKQINRFLALSIETPITRYLQLQSPIQPILVPFPLRILVMVSSPIGYPGLNVEEEWKRLSATLTPLVDRRLVSLERIQPVTLAALQAKLRQGKFHILHFIGHGKFDEATQDGVLLFEDDKGYGREISGQYLGTILHDHRSLRLVVLNSCEGARTGLLDPFSGIAQSLVQQGIPAVIAMQFEITDQAAITFSHEFYTSLADSYPVDSALGEARKAIFSQGNDIEWGTPVLFTRAPDGIIFDLDQQKKLQPPISPPLIQKSEINIPTDDKTNILESIKGRYQILEQLGEGGIATVYRAYDTLLERQVALKVLRRVDIPSRILSDMMLRFEIEAKALARLSHPNIVRVIDYGEFEGAPCLVLEYVSGGSLKHKLGSPLNWMKAVQLLLPVVRAFNYAHAQGIVHCALKPANILIAENGEPMVGSFGITKIIGTTFESETAVSGVGFSTPEYMAPEQGMGKPGDRRTDVYAIGIIFYEMVTGRCPFQADTPIAVVLKHIADPLPRPGNFGANLPNEVEQILFKALAKEPENRYQTMSDLARVLENLLINSNLQDAQKQIPVGATGDAGIVGNVVTNQPQSVAGQADIPISPLQDTKSKVKVIGRQFWIYLTLAIVFLLMILAFALSRLNQKQPNYITSPNLTSTTTRSPTSTITVMSKSTLTPNVMVLPSTDQPARSTSTPNPAEIIDAKGVSMILISAGAFQMGCDPNNAPEYCQTDEKPFHAVMLDAYYIDKYEVTIAFYKLCVEDGICSLPAFVSPIYNRSDYYDNPTYTAYPIVFVSWFEAAQFCKWRGGRLPTEAEWEKASRGDQDTRMYPWGNQEPECMLANYSTCYNNSSEVGSLPKGASPYGILDMAGNVGEWVNDWYDSSYYFTSPANNPPGPESGQYKVMRGGGWSNPMSFIRTTNRTGYSPDHNYFSVGFRCATSPGASLTPAPNPTLTPTTTIKPN